MAIMESTTLVTFMLQHSAARKVELLGSWDNFADSYGMEKDRRRGKGNWTGCHNFRNIICDGDVTDIREKRAGGLKMGGTYWYFYRIDDDEELHDPSQETTTSCPLMPGQTLNILEVPYDNEHFTSHSRSSSLSLSSIVQTLNPDDRYLTPRPTPKPQLTKLITSAEAAPSARHLSDASTKRRQRPWSAIASSSIGGDDESRHSFREIKSASGSPTYATDLSKTAFVQIKSPASALTPSQGGRGRSRILHGDHLRTHRTKSPSSKELPKSIPQPTAMDSSPTGPSRYGDQVEKVEMSSRQPILSQKRSPSSNPLLRRLQESDAPDKSDEFPPPAKRGRDAYHTETDGAARSSHERSFSDSFSSRRSSSMGRRREPSPLRRILMSQEAMRVIDGLQIPTCVPEADIEEPVSPQKRVNSQELEDHMSLYERRQSSTTNPSETTFVTEPEAMIQATSRLVLGPDVDEASPDLPTGVIPQVLSVRSEAREMQLALQALHQQYTAERYHSPWRAEFDIPLPESPNASHGQKSGVQSPTFSSIKDDTSGLCTPNRRLSELQDWSIYSTPFPDAVETHSRFADVVPRTTGTKSTDSTLMPAYQLPIENPFKSEKGQDHESEQRQLTQMEQLLDEFHYLGAALL